MKSEGAQVMFKELPDGAVFRVPGSDLHYTKTSGTVEALRTYKYNATTATTRPGVANPPFAPVGGWCSGVTTWYCMIPDDEPVEPIS